MTRSKRDQTARRHKISRGKPSQHEREKPRVPVSKQLHYDRGPVTNADSGGLQEVEWINLQWKTLTSLNDSYRTTGGFAPALAPDGPPLRFVKS
jgi:hypothetical protein